MPETRGARRHVQASIINRAVRQYLKRRYPLQNAGGTDPVTLQPIDLIPRPHLFVMDNHGFECVAFLEWILRSERNPLNMEPVGLEDIQRCIEQARTLRDNNACTLVSLCDTPVIVREVSIFPPRQWLATVFISPLYKLTYFDGYVDNVGRAHLSYDVEQRTGPQFLPDGAFVKPAPGVREFLFASSDEVLELSTADPESTRGTDSDFVIF